MSSQCKTLENNVTLFSLSLRSSYRYLSCAGKINGCIITVNTKSVKLHQVNCNVTQTNAIRVTNSTEWNRSAGNSFSCIGNTRCDEVNNASVGRLPVEADDRLFGLLCKSERYYCILFCCMQPVTVLRTGSCVSEAASVVSALSSAPFFLHRFGIEFLPNLLSFVA